MVFHYSATPLPLLPYFGHRLVCAVNALLAREAWARARLARHAGKTVRLMVPPPAAPLPAWWRCEVTVRVVTDGRLVLAEMPADTAAPPDVTLTILSERLTLARLRQTVSGADSDRAADGLADLLHIAGDAALAQDLAELARYLRPDIEDLLAERIGDIAAVRLVQAARSARDGVRSSGARLAGNVAEYLSEEAELLLARPRFDDAAAALAALDARVAALAARVATLDARLALTRPCGAPSPAGGRGHGIGAACSPLPPVGQRLGCLRGTASPQAERQSLCDWPGRGLEVRVTTQREPPP